MRRWLLVLACLPLTGAGVAAPAVRWTPEGVSTPGYESSPSFTPDGRTMFYVSADTRFRNYRLMAARCRGGAWTPSPPPTFASGPPVLEADPFVSHDGSRLYFISTRHDPANEDFDIYMSERLEDGSWSDARRLPAPVNSPASELLPRQDAAGRLYFGSARAGGLGQSDIYVAVERSPGEWVVANAGPPVSTPANEYEAEVSRDGRSLVVVADRGERSRLYRFEASPGGWREIGEVPALRDVFQVGPLLSPLGTRLLFAQAAGQLSGEMFVIDLASSPREAWPPNCAAPAPALKKAPRNDGH